MKIINLALHQTACAKQSHALLEKMFQLIALEQTSATLLQMIIQQEHVQPVTIRFNQKIAQRISIATPQENALRNPAILMTIAI